MILFILLVNFLLCLCDSKIMMNIFKNKIYFMHLILGWSSRKQFSKPVIVIEGPIISCLCFWARGHNRVCYEPSESWMCANSHPYDTDFTMAKALPSAYNRKQQCTISNRSWFLMAYAPHFTIDFKSYWKRTLSLSHLYENLPNPLFFYFITKRSDSFVGTECQGECDKCCSDELCFTES